MAQDTTREKRLPDLLSAPELAAYLGVPVSTIHYWRGKEQGPPAFKLGKQLRFRASDVAKVVGLHPHYALRLFRSVMNVPLHEFVVRMRLIQPR